MSDPNIEVILTQCPQGERMKFIQNIYELRRKLAEVEQEFARRRQ